MLGILLLLSFNHAVGKVTAIDIDKSQTNLASGRFLRIYNSGQQYSTNCLLDGFEE